MKEKVRQSEEIIVVLKNITNRKNKKNKCERVKKFLRRIVDDIRNRV